MIGPADLDAITALHIVFWTTVALGWLVVLAAVWGLTWYA